MRRSASLALLFALQLLSVVATQLIVVRNVGIGSETDGFIAAQTAAMVLAAILQVGLQSIWLPRLSASAGRSDSWRTMLESAISQSLLLSLATFSILSSTSGIWLPIIFSAFDSEQISQAKITFLLFAIAYALNTVSSQLATALRTNGKYIFPEILSTLVVIASLPAIYHFAKPGALAIIAGVTALRSLIIIIIQLKLLAWPSISLRLRGNITKDWRQMRPVLVGASLYKMLPLFDRALAGLGPSGGLTIFNLAQSGVGAIASVLERSVCVPITATFGRYAAEKRFNNLRLAYRSGVTKISILTMIYFIVMLIGKSQFEYVVATILKVPPSTSESLWWLCIILVGYLHAAASGTLVVAAIQALGDTKTPVKIAVIGFLLSLPLKIVGFYLYGISGIVIVSSAHYVANLAVMIVCCERKIISESVRQDQI